MRKTEYHVEQITNMLNENEYDKALDYIQSLSDTEKANWEINNVIGLICFNLNQFDEAESFFRKAMEYSEDNNLLYYNLANVYFKQKKYDHSMLMLKCAESINCDLDLQNDILELKTIIKSQNLSASLNNNALMIAYYFPPLAGSGVYRSLKFAKYLPGFDWNPTVISTDVPPKGWNFSDNTLIKEIPDSVNVIRIPDNVSTGRKSELSSDDVKKLLNILCFVFQNDKNAIDIIREIISTSEGIINLISFPCPCLYWALNTIEYIEKNIDINQYKVIYTTSGPSSAHLIGYYLKKKYNVKWVADYRDMWTGNPYSCFDENDVWYQLLLRLESILLRSADHNIVVSNGDIDNYVNRFGLSRKYFTSITNGYDEQDFEELEVKVNSNSKFTLTYSGILYTKQRSLAPVFDAVRQLCEEGKIDKNEIALKIVGEGNEDENIRYASEYGLAGVITQTGYVSHKTALEENANSNILILLIGDEAKFKSVYTGKVFDYLRTGKSILAIAPKNGVVDEMLMSTNRGETFYSYDIDGIKEMIYKEYNKWKAGSYTTFDNLKIGKYERKYLTMKLADVFCSISDSKEYSCDVYNEAYRNGGCEGNYHKNYQQSFYYDSWLFAMNYILLLDRDVKILEIGCGAGQFASMLFDYGFMNYRGFDYAEEGVALSKKNNPQNEDCFFVGDAFESSAVTEDNDLIICFEVLEHIQNDLKLISRIPKGTKLLFSVPNFDDPYHVRFFKSKEEVYNRYNESIDIYNIGVHYLNQYNCLYYIVGVKR